MRRDIDFIIVGQGIAGSMVGYRLQNAGYEVLIYDEAGPNASKAAAGIINPITGRSFVKSWQFDLLYLEARALYQTLEEELNISIWHELPLYRTLHAVRDENKVSARMQMIDYSNHFDGIGQLPDIQSIGTTLSKSRCVKIQAAKCELHTLMGALRAKWKTESRLIEERFDAAAIEWLPSGGLKYGDIKARQVIFCQGHHAAKNKLFSKIPIQGYYGQAFLLKRQAWPNLMYKNRQFTVPWSQQQIWFGSSNSHRDWSIGNTKDATSKLKDDLVRWFGKDRHIDEVLEGVRPTTPDRRPIVGAHKSKPAAIIFNGLGTKGASLAPWLSRVMLDWIEGRQVLPGEIDLARFAPFF